MLICSTELGEAAAHVCLGGQVPSPVHASQDGLVACWALSLSGPHTMRIMAAAAGPLSATVDTSLPESG